jgi:hypothetical protein
LGTATGYNIHTVIGVLTCDYCLNGPYSFSHFVKTVLCSTYCEERSEEHTYVSQNTVLHRPSTHTPHRRQTPDRSSDFRVPTPLTNCGPRSTLGRGPVELSKCSIQQPSVSYEVSDSVPSSQVCGLRSVRAWVRASESLAHQSSQFTFQSNRQSLTQIDPLVRVAPRLLSLP